MRKAATYSIVQPMEQLGNEIRLASADPALNALLRKGAGAAAPGPGRHYTHNEEFFLALPADIIIPHFPIHHDVRRNRPSEAYSSALAAVVEGLVSAIPAALGDLASFFDPGETLKPCFFRLYKVADALYLYLLRIDLLFRPAHHELIEAGDNDTTPSYRSRRLFLESEFIPLEEVVEEGDAVKAFRIKQLISQTWIGETGRGYMVRGIWMDSELSKFFSKLFLPAGLRSYPYYPFICKYRTICGAAIEPEEAGRERFLPLLHRAFCFLLPELDRIQKELRSEPFDEGMELFRSLRERVAGAWEGEWTGLRVRSYLNRYEMKEYEVIVD